LITYLSNKTAYRIVSPALWLLGSSEDSSVWAAELGLPYVALCVAVNAAAGRGGSADQVSMEGIAQVLESAMDKVRRLLDHVVPLVEDKVTP